MNFSKLPYDKRVNEVNKRLNSPIGRITTIDELLKLDDKSLYLVLSPMTNNGNVSNALIIDWQFGRIEDEFGNIIISVDGIDITSQVKYFIYHLDTSHNHKAIECKDVNIIPNNYNNHAVFNNINDAKSYVVQRKLTYTLSQELDDLDMLNDTNVRIWLTRDEIKKYHELEK